MTSQGHDAAPQPDWVYTIQTDTILPGQKLPRLIPFITYPYLQWTRLFGVHCVQQTLGHRKGYPRWQMLFCLKTATLSAQEFNWRNQNLKHQIHNENKGFLRPLLKASAFDSKEPLS